MPYGAGVHTRNLGRSSPYKELRFKTDRTESEPSRCGSQPKAEDSDGWTVESGRSSGTRGCHE